MATPPVASPFGDSLLCPVCFILFEGRILQCSQGHAVCEKCHSQLSECPHCRGVFVGTRNYVLEEVIAKLKKISAGNAFLSLGKDASTATVIKKPVEKKSTNEAPADAVVISETDQESTVAMPNNNVADLLESLNFDFLQTPAASVRDAAPIQSEGRFACRAIGCAIMLPICRLLNHARCFHKDILTEYKTDATNAQDDFLEHWTIPCRKSQRKIFQIPKFGLFYLIFNVHKNFGDTSVKAWIQCACNNSNAREFRFTLALVLGDSVSSYTDFVYGAQSDAAYIEHKNQCLSVNTNGNFRNAVLEVKIGRTIGPRNILRNSNTVLRVIPPNLSSSPSRNEDDGGSVVNAPATNEPITRNRRGRRNQNRRR